MEDIKNPDCRADSPDLLLNFGQGLDAAGAEPLSLSLCPDPLEVWIAPGLAGGVVMSAQKDPFTGYERSLSAFGATIH